MTIYPQNITGRQLDQFQITEGKYTAQFAHSSEQVSSALQLRYAVFNIELGEGLSASEQTGLDQDQFDEQCSHLIVTHRPSASIVGTYRMQSYEDAIRHKGFYSETEFDLQQIPGHVLTRSMEVGRACIHAAHRNNRVLFLLWKGLAAFLLYKQLRYLFGCCSIPSQEMQDGLRVLAELRERGLVRSDFEVPAKPGHECVGKPGAASVEIPKLFKSYINHGALVCSAPAIDRHFRTIDFLVILDKEDLSHFSRRLFFPEEYL